MAIIQVIPHSLVGVETSMAFVPFSVAAETVPKMSIAIVNTERARPSNKL